MAVGPSRVLFEGGPQVSCSTPAQTSLSTTAAVILIANPKRKGVIVQNTGTTVIKLSLGPTLPTQTVYHVALKAGTGADDGTGGVFIDENWVGIVNAISSAPGGTFVVSEIMTGSPDWNQASDFGRWTGW